MMRFHEKDEAEEGSQKWQVWHLEELPLARIKNLEGQA